MHQTSETVTQLDSVFDKADEGLLEGTMPSQQYLAYQDITDGIKRWRIWLMLAYQDIKLRYRRSIIGPFWITISMAVTVYTMAFLYAHIFKQDLAKYFPFLATGMLCWTLVSTIITEVAEGFVAAEGLLKQVKLPYTVYLHRIACRNIIIFLHNVFVLIPILIIYHETAPVNLNTLIVIPGMALLYLNTMTYGMIVAMVGARFRDIAQVIKSLLQVVFFVTPVMWTPDVLGPNKQFIVTLNPVYAMLDIIRSPMMGKAPSFNSVVAAGIVTAVGLLVSIKFFTRYRARIIYWV